MGAGFDWNHCRIAWILWGNIYRSPSKFFQDGQEGWGISFSIWEPRFKMGVPIS